MLRLLIKTNLLVSNREAGSAFLSYLGYILGGVILAFIAIVPILEPLSKQTRSFPLMFFTYLCMFDYFVLQFKLKNTSLTEKRSLELFPLSQIRSANLRFVTFLTEQRILLYFIPLSAVLLALIKKGNIVQLVAAALLYILIYIIISEILFAVFPIFRKLADRFSEKTVTQGVALSLIFLIILMSVFHGTMDENTHIVIVSEFTNAMEDIAISNVTAVGTQLGRLTVILIMLGTMLVLGNLLATQPFLDLRFMARQTRKKEDQPSFARSPDAGTASQISSRKVISGHMMDALRQSIFNLSLLDWKIRHKEEKTFYMIIAYPFLAVALEEIISRRFHYPVASMIFPIFFVTLMFGLALTENQLTQHGLRLEHISIFPSDRSKFIYLKSLSTWSIISIVNIAMCIILGFRFHIGIYQLLQGTIFSLFQPLILIILVNTFNLQFNALYSISIISFLIIVVAEIFAMIIYVLLMLLNLAVATLLVAGLFAITYFIWMPAWGRKLSIEFQTLLEE